MIYVDTNFKCHVNNPDGIFRKVILSENARAFFANKCTVFIEGYRLKPDGETWIRDDGKVFSGGEMIVSWKDYRELAAAQAQYERMMEEAATAYREGVDSV